MAILDHFRLLFLKLFTLFLIHEKIKILFEIYVLQKKRDNFFIADLM